MAKKLKIIILFQWILIFALVSALAAVSMKKPTASASKPSEANAIEITESRPNIITEILLSEPQWTLLGEFKTTAYCTCVKCCGIWSQAHPSRSGTGYIQKTASGTIPTAGRTVSVDPSIIPLGSVLTIDGQEYVAEDTGSAIKDNVIDIYFDSHEDALQYGVQTKTIYIKGE